jgi:hypothetical protein
VRRPSVVDSGFSEASRYCTYSRTICRTTFMHLINDQVLSRRVVAEARYNLSSSITTEAEERVSFDKVYLRYPPVKQRGVGVSPRATGFGTNFEPFYSKPIRPFYCHPDLNLKGEAKRQGDCRGEQRGCPILFMSPAGLSISAGRPGRLDDPRNTEPFYPRW